MPTQQQNDVRRGKTIGGCVAALGALGLVVVASVTLAAGQERQGRADGRASASRSYSSGVREVQPRASDGARSGSPRWSNPTPATSRWSSGVSADRVRTIPPATVRDRPATVIAPRSDSRPAARSGSAVMSVPGTSRPSTSGLAADLSIRTAAAERSRDGGSADSDSSKTRTERARPADLRGKIPDTSASKSSGSRSARGSSDAADSGRSDLSRSALGAKPSTPAASLSKDRGGSDDVRKLPTTKVPTERSRAADLRSKIPDVAKPKSTLGPPATAGSAGAEGSKVVGDSKAVIPKSTTERPKLSEIRKEILEGKKPKPEIGKKTFSELPTKPGTQFVRPKPTIAGGKKLDLPPPVRTPFVERVEKGQLGKLAKGDVAQKVKLGEQYRMMQQGDVARRMGIAAREKNVTNVKNITNVTNVTNVARGGYRHLPHHVRPSNFVYFGWVSPFYVQSCFDFRYCGPSYFASFCWYPRWSPWVNWSWHYHGLPLWDPRPFWCRPIVYVPAPVWVYYDVPVWRPLPEVACGTWVNVKKVVVPLQQFDLQLLAVRFVDPGHPDEKLGPRYRVWFRNNSDQPVSQPFSVTLLASADGKLQANLPQAGARIASIGGGETKSVDVRLPFEVSQMGRGADGKPAPFGTLHVLVDANREVNEVDRSNNGLAIVQAEVLPVDPVAFEVEPNSVAAGGEVILAGEGLGPEPGKVLVHLGGLEMEAEIVGWYDLGVRLNVPRMPLTSPTQAELIVVRGDGAAANPIQVTVNPPALGQPEAAPPPAGSPRQVPPPPPAPTPSAPKLEPPKLGTPPASH